MRKTYEHVCQNCKIVFYTCTPKPRKYHNPKCSAEGKSRALNEARIHKRIEKLTDNNICILNTESGQ